MFLFCLFLLFFKLVVFYLILLGREVPWSSISPSPSPEFQSNNQKQNQHSPYHSSNPPVPLQPLQDTAQSFGMAG